MLTRPIKNRYINNTMQQSESLVFPVWGRCFPWQENSNVSDPMVFAVLLLHVICIKKENRATITWSHMSSESPDHLAFENIL
jgi:hypothetical protein